MLRSVFRGVIGEEHISTATDRLSQMVTSLRGVRTHDGTHSTKPRIVSPWQRVDATTRKCHRQWRQRSRTTLRHRSTNHTLQLATVVTLDQQ